MSASCHDQNGEKLLFAKHYQRLEDVFESFIDLWELGNQLVSLPLDNIIDGEFSADENTITDKTLHKRKPLIESEDRFIANSPLHFSEIELW